MKDLLKEPMNIVKKMKSLQRTGTEWQVELTEPIVTASWFNYKKIRPISKVTANLHFWVVDHYNKCKVYWDKRHADEAKKAGKPVHSNL